MFYDFDSCTGNKIIRMSPGSEANIGLDTAQREDVDEATVSSISITLDSQPSCLEFSCHNSEYFVVGTYVLEENQSSVPDVRETLQRDKLSRPKQNRSGSLMLFRLQGHNLYGRRCCITWWYLALDF